MVLRITLNTRDNKDLSFFSHRTQFPVRLTLDVTVSKSERLTFDRIALRIEKNKPIFGHGHLYVALS